MTQYFFLKMWSYTITVFYVLDVFITHICKDRVVVVVVVVVVVIFHRLPVFFFWLGDCGFPFVLGRWGLLWSIHIQSGHGILGCIISLVWTKIKVLPTQIFGSVLVLSQIHLYPFFGVASLCLIGNDYRSVQTRPVTHLSCRWSPLCDEYCMGQSAIIMFPLNWRYMGYPPSRDNPITVILFPIDAHAPNDTRAEMGR